MNKAEIGVPIASGFLMIIGLAVYHGAWWQYVTAAAFFLIILPYCAITLERLRKAQPDNQSECPERSKR